MLEVRFKPELFDLLEAHADDFNLAVNGIAPALGPLMNDGDIARLTAIAEIWLGKDADAYSAIGDLMAWFKPEALLREVQTATGVISPGMARCLASAMSDRSDDESFALLADLLITHPEQTTSSFSLALMRNDDRASETRYRCLTSRHIDAIWHARYVAILWEDALSKVCSLRPDLKSYIVKMAEAHEGIEAIALRYCSGTDNDTLFAALEQLLEPSDETLQNNLFEFFPLSNLDWRGREKLLVQSLGRHLHRLHRALIGDMITVSTLARGSVDLATMRPAIEQLEARLESDNQWLFPHRLGRIAAHLGDAEVLAFCLDALAHGGKRIRNWVKSDYLSSVEGLTSDALDDDMIAVLLADLNVPEKIVVDWYNPLGAIATDRFVQERLLPLAEGASTTFLENLKPILQVAGDRHGKRYLLPK